ncbi:unnamed protein product [Mytilus edulis]|uniref:Integrase catalytic domain-containing protein n=1 Tax=Mytilus edulis TaxID=6550 RepID=A0A8S3U2S0_MYTED|nr:unnamed protein product [Mytilus edulis]
MLYQKHPSDTGEQIRVVRFGSKSMNSWQKSYGPTKLELLGDVTSIVDCASYLRGDRFTVECDHQALRSIFQNQFKGAIYDRWLAVLQQFNFDIKYKPAADMQVPDALSRVKNAPLLDVNAEESLNENDPIFQTRRNVTSSYSLLRKWNITETSEGSSSLLKAPDYSMVDDLLFHSRVAKSKRTQRMGEFQLVIPKQLIPKVLETYHQTPLAGHMGIQQTVDNISEQFYFQNLPSTVSSYVRSCHDCQERKMTKAHTKSEIISFRTPTETFQTWQVDLFGPLPITQKGNAYIFTAVDMFSKLLFCVPLLSSDSVTVSHALFQLVCTFGVCDCVISDKGSEFISQCTDQLCKILEVNQNFTPSFIHHCLGLCERT